MHRLPRLQQGCLQRCACCRLLVGSACYLAGVQLQKFLSAPCACLPPAKFLHTHTPNFFLLFLLFVVWVGCVCVCFVCAPLLQGLTGNGTCSCNPNFADPDCKCLTEKAVGNTTVCETCPPGYGGDSCVVCPGSIVTPNGTVTSWCSGHGQCPLSSGGAAGGPAVCKCEDPHQGADCSQCFDGYVPIAGQTCAECPGLVNPADSGAYSGGKVLVSCFYKGLCKPASDNSTAQCTNCSPGWSGSNCCVWTGGSSPVVIIPAVTLAVLIVLAIAIINGRNNVKWTLLLFSPTLQVGGWCLLRVTPCHKAVVLCVW